MELPLQDKVQSLLDRIDDGRIFETIIVSLLKLLSFVFLGGAVFYTFFGMFGSDGWFLGLYDGPWDVMWKITGSLGFIIGLAGSLAVTYFAFLIIWRRANQLGDKEYTGLLHYLYTQVAPTLIVIVGEFMSLMALAVGILSLFSTLIGSFVYFPLMQMAEGPVFLGFPGYDGFVDRLLEAPVGGIVGAVLLLIGTYLALEVYAYLCRLVRVVIKFLPRFAIPLAVRKREIPEDQKFL